MSKLPFLTLAASSLALAGPMLVAPAPAWSAAADNESGLEFNTFDTV